MSYRTISAGHRAGLTTAEQLQEAGGDLWIAAIRWHTQFKTQMYVNVPAFEIHLPEPEQKFCFTPLFTFEFTQIKPEFNWRQFAALS